MPGRQAKVLAPRAVGAALRFVSRRPLACRERVILLLSVKAGLRACEIARLEWPMVLDARGEVARAIELPDRAAKRRSGRRIIGANFRDSLLSRHVIHRLDDTDGKVG